VTFDYERGESWSFGRLMYEVKDTKKLIEAILNEEDGKLANNSDCWIVKCPNLNIASKIESRSEVKQLLERIFTEHFQIALDQKCRMENLDKQLEVIFWNREEHRQWLQRKDEYEQSKPTSADTIFFGTRSRTHPETKITTSADNYQSFFKLIASRTLGNWQKLPFSHALPIPYGIVTSSEYLETYDKTPQRWPSLSAFLASAKSHILNAEIPGVSKDALKYQVGNYQLDWAVSACFSISKEHPLFQEALLATQEARLTCQLEDSAIIMEALQAVRDNIRINIMLKKKTSRFISIEESERREGTLHPEPPSQKRPGIKFVSDQPKHNT
jgi:hypothetical protein